MDVKYDYLTENVNEYQTLTSSFEADLLKQNTEELFAEARELENLYRPHITEDSMFDRPLETQKYVGTPSTNLYADCNGTNEAGTDYLGEINKYFEASSLPSIHVSKESSQSILNPDNTENFSIFDSLMRIRKTNPYDTGEETINYGKAPLDADGSYEYQNSYFKNGTLPQNSTMTSPWHNDTNKNDQCRDNAKVNEISSGQTAEYSMSEPTEELIESTLIADGNYSFRVLRLKGCENKKKRTVGQAMKRGRKSSTTSSRHIPSRFQLTLLGKKLNLSMLESNIQCLSVIIDYDDYKGVLSDKPKIDKNLINDAKLQEIPNTFQDKLIMLFDFSMNDSPPPVSGLWQRVKYDRNIDLLTESITSIIYKKSSVYGPNSPYEPQYYRFELDENGSMVNESKCGLCPYCEKIKFLPFKNSSYLSHLTLEHGIFSNNYLIPEALCYGKYFLAKSDSGEEQQIFEKPSTQKIQSTTFLSNDLSKKKNQHRPRKAEGIVCPACFEVIEVGCWKIKSNPLLSYFRHFKKLHKLLTTNSAHFQTNKLLNINNRGRKLQILE